MSEFNQSNFEQSNFIQNKIEKSSSKFTPKIIVLFIIFFAIYYFFNPILSYIINNFITNNTSIENLKFLHMLIKNFIVPGISIIIIISLYIILLEERSVKFIFVCFKDKILNYIIKGSILAVFLIFSLILTFILKDYMISFKFNKEFSIINLFQLIFMFIAFYFKTFALEYFYRGWLLDIILARYSLSITIIIGAILPTIVSFIYFQRIGLYVIYIFLLNVFVILIFFLYRNIYITSAFIATYDFIKKYVLSLESVPFDLNQIFYTVINNKEVYNIENNFTSLIVLVVFILVVFSIYKIRFNKKGYDFRILN